MAYGQFISLLTIDLPVSGVVGDVYFTTDTKLLYVVVGDGSLIQLLQAIPIQVAGPPGPVGNTGEAGPPFFATIVYTGTWSATVNYIAGSIVSYNGFLYLANQTNYDNPPASNPYWTLLGPTTVTSGRPSEIVIVVDGAAQVPSVGLKGYFQAPFDCTITGWTLFADQTGSVVFDVKWGTYNSFPSTASIVASANPQLVSQQKNEATSVLSWTKTVLKAGEILEFDVLSVSTVTLLTLTLTLALS